MTATTDETVAERLEAQIRSAMARLPKSRGWDSERERQAELVWLDTLLDRFNSLGR